MDILLDDACPEITFFSSTGRWIDDHRKGTQYPDDYLSSYSQQTFHTTYGDGDYMQYRFNGTGIKIIGSKRKNHGVYGVKIDDEEETYYSGFSANPIFQTELYTRNNLTTSNEHTITITNYPERPDPQPSSTTDAWLDIDQLIISQNLSGDVYTTTIDNIAPGISYDGTWTSDKGYSANYNKTIHISYQTGDSFILPFTGSSIQVFSGMNVDHLDYSVSLDGGPEFTYNGTHFERLHQIPHFTASGLTEGQHALKFTNRGRDDIARPVMGFDYAIVNSTISPDGSTSGDTTSQQARPTFAPVSNDSPEQSSGSHHVNAKAIAGGVAGGVIALIAVAILAWHLLCRNPRSKGSRKSSEDQHKSYIDFANSNNLRSLGEVMETKTSSRLRMISNTSGNDSTKVNTISGSYKSSPSKSGSFGKMFSKKSVKEPDPESSRSDSPEGSIAYFYTPHPGRNNRSNSAGSRLSPRRIDAYDDQIYRGPLPVRPRHQVNLQSSQLDRPRNSITSRSSIYSQGGETYITDRLDSIQQTFANGNSPIPLPSPPSQESSEYEHMPLPPIPAVVNAASTIQGNGGSSTSDRPNFVHADASSALLPSATIQQSLKSTERPLPANTSSVKVSSSSATNFSPFSTSTRSTGQTATSSPVTPGDYKRGILGLVLDTTPFNIPGAEPTSSENTATQSSNSKSRLFNLTPSILDLEPPIASPPPGYEHAMTSQQEQRSLET
ncbi:uncharacterized protein I206_105934 [Kwoniella pini CBS 10737]|uniref:Uncharacterized protein n=1 Tax=Kwoniella pini CBS 10737 TaxID=1296096 RepID=A0A1B9I0K8_9TREE|nr:uncharacterized protein I206_04757 [Kwoniella pini CBS 10737]OCF49070.1 hypothetical protein I206_04757 [Kwoniella pini CBS 10737]